MGSMILMFTKCMYRRVHTCCIDEHTHATAKLHADEGEALECQVESRGLRVLVDGDELECHRIGVAVDSDDAESLRARLRVRGDTRARDDEELKTFVSGNERKQMCGPAPVTFILE